MYRAAIEFADLRDAKHLYHAGDKFPREGLTVSNERIAELSGTANKMRRPLIVEVKEEGKKEGTKKPSRKRR